MHHAFSRCSAAVGMAPGGRKTRLRAVALLVASLIAAAAAQGLTPEPPSVQATAPAAGAQPAPAADTQPAIKPAAPAVAEQPAAQPAAPVA